MLYIGVDAVITTVVGEEVVITVAEGVDVAEADFPQKIIILNILIKISDNHLEIRDRRPIKEMILATVVA